jgi:DDE family transposase
MRQATRGYSRDHRSECKQVLIALLVTFDGFLLGDEVFASNTHDAKTLQTIVATMEAHHGVVARVWISDRGMASRDNLARLRETKRRYIVGAPKSELKKFGRDLAQPEGWRTVHEGVEVKLARHPETEETVIVCRSADRRSKERAMHDKFSGRIRIFQRLMRAAKRSSAAGCNRSAGLAPPDRAANPRPDPPALRHPARRRASRAARPPWHRPAQAHLPGRARAHRAQSRRLTSLSRKCSANFLANPLICLMAWSKLRKLG